MRTQVGIVGAGPAGLVLSHLLDLAGIESVVLEARSRAYVESRVRAGVLEHPTAELLRDTGVGARLAAEGLVHGGIELRFDRQGHRVDFRDLVGKTITVYGQQEVVKDLIAARLEAGGSVLFDVGDVAVHGVDTDRPRITYRHEDADQTLECDVIAGCDGFHGVCRPSIPDGVLTVYERDYPYGWLGVLAAVAPSTEELIYTNHPRGFAMHSLRSPELSRLYLQVDPADDIANWPDDRIWSELHARFEAPGWELREGPIIEKGITAMRSFVVEPLRHGRLFLAGDSAHIVPPTGAKGLNLAVADVRVLAAALTAFFAEGRTDLLDAYSDTCLARVWRVQRFSTWMTTMLHQLPGGDPFDDRLQRAQLTEVVASRAAATALAEHYTGLPMP